MKKNNAKLEYAYLLDEYGFTSFEECSEEDNKKYAAMLETGEPLPDYITPKLDEYGNHDGTFYFAIGDAITNEEKGLLLQMKKLKELKMIKYGLIYLSVMLTFAMFALIYC